MWVGLLMTLVISSLSILFIKVSLLMTLVISSAPILLIQKGSKRVITPFNHYLTCMVIKHNDHTVLLHTNITTTYDLVIGCGVDTYHI